MVAARGLYPSYANGADGDAQIPLPDPDDTGWIRALVLFKYGVTSLRFCPVQAPARFRVEDFSLRRMSRSSALRRMLGATASEPGGLLSRTSGYAAGVFRNGLSNATDVLYRASRPPLSPRQHPSH